MRYETYEYWIMCIDARAKNIEISDWNAHTYS